MELEDCLKEFAYIFVRSFEEKLKYWLTYLENRQTKLNTSKPGTILSTAVAIIPQVGKGLASAVKHGDQFVQNRLESSTAQSFADITYFSENNKDAFRLILIEGAVDLFCKYEYQFSVVSCNGGVIRAAQKLGSDAAQRMISFLLENKCVSLTPGLVAKGIVNGNSPRNSKKVISSGRSLILNEETVSTADFFANTGIRLENDRVITYYTDKNCLNDLRHRLTFSWEDREKIISSYKVDRPEYSYKYQFIFRNKSELVEMVRQFITTKDPIEDVKEFIRVRDDELEMLIKSSNDDISALQVKGMDENKEDHHLTREHISKTEEAIITYLGSVVFETLKENLEDDRRKREEFDKIKREEEEARKRIKEEERKLREEEERRVREEEERRRKEEADALIEKIKEQQQIQLPERAIIVDGDRVKQELKKVEDCVNRELRKGDMEVRRVGEKIRNIRIKW